MLFFTQHKKEALRLFKQDFSNQRRCEMQSKLFPFIVCLAIIFVFCLRVALDKTQLESQQRQIEQLCAAMPTALLRLLPEDFATFNFNELNPNTYTVFFVDYAKSSALTRPLKNNAIDGRFYCIAVNNIPPEVIKNLQCGKTFEIPNYKSGGGFF